MKDPRRVSHPSPAGLLNASEASDCSAVGAEEAVVERGVDGRGLAARGLADLAKSQYPYSGCLVALRVRKTTFPMNQVRRIRNGLRRAKRHFGT